MSAYIKTTRKTFEYPDLPTATRALPRMRRADPSARIIPPSEAYATLSQTPSDQMVLQPSPRKGRR